MTSMAFKMIECSVGTVSGDLVGLAGPLALTCRAARMAATSVMRASIFLRSSMKAGVKSFNKLVEWTVW
jgi:hypothetical protein